MNSKRDQDILRKVSEALNRRQNLGLTANQLKELVNKNNHNSNKGQLQSNPEKIVRSNARRAIFSMPPDRNDKIFLSGSIGDVFAIESFFSDEERSKLSTIYYATQKAHTIKLLFESLPNYPLLKNHNIVWNDFSNFWCFFSKQECIERIRGYQKEVDQYLFKAKDQGISSVFPLIHSGAIHYNGSSFVKHQIADISHWDLPEMYYAICAHSTDKRLGRRDFDLNDWRQTTEFLKRNKITGIVLGVGDDFVPDSDVIVNLMNKTNMVEAVEILKKANGYIGIDSSLSVIASQLFSWPNLKIKSVNNHLYDNARCYYFPQKDFRFLCRSVLFE